MPKKYKYTRAITFEGHRYFVRGDTEREVSEKAALKLRDLEEGRVALKSTMKVSDWVNECIEAYKAPHLSDIAMENTWIRAKKYIIEPIGDLQLKAVQPIDCQQCLNRLSGMSNSWRSM